MSERERDEGGVSLKSGVCVGTLGDSITFTEAITIKFRV